MKIIYNNILPKKGYIAINICGVLFARKEYKPVTERTINHEAIHSRQIFEMLIVFFYLWYAIEWIIRLIQYRNTKLAYRNISFEREAYANQLDMDYLKSRGWYNYMTYIF